jgi:hypothetical protein
MNSPTLFTNALLSKIDLGSGWHLNIVSHRIATITNPKGHRKITYFGFATEEQALQFKAAIEQLGAISSAVVRPSQRLSHYAWECKVWGCPTQLIIALFDH